MKGISFLFIFLLSACASNNEDPTPNGKLARQFQQCYWESDSIFAKPPVEGVMKLKVTIDPQGKADSVKILESAFSKDRNFEACVYGLLKSFPYEPAKDGKDYFYDQVINFTVKKNENI